LNWRDIFSFRGVNLWHLASSVGWNILWTGGSLVFSIYFLEKSPDSYLVIQLGLMITIFVVSLAAGLLFGKLGADGRGLTYGVIGSLGSAMLSLFIILPSGGLLGLMLAAIALAGGLNGGLLSMRK